MVFVEYSKDSYIYYSNIIHTSIKIFSSYKRLQISVSECFQIFRNSYLTDLLDKKNFHFMSLIEINQRLANSFVDLRHCSDNHICLNPKHKVCLIYPLLIHKSVALNLSSIIVLRIRTTSETIIHI